MTGNDILYTPDQNDTDILKKTNPPIDFIIPHVNIPVVWKNTNKTYIIGMNGSGKTLLLHTMMDWCNDNDFTYCHYNAFTALSEADYYIENSADVDIIYACKMMSELSLDFSDDISGWAKHKNGGTFDNIGDWTKDADLLRMVLSMCGVGYTRMFVMVIKAIQNPTADYYFLDLPETSLHLHLSQVIVNFLMKNFEYMKFVVTTHSPEVISDAFNNKDTKYLSVIELEPNHIANEKNRKFNEIF